ncbi:MAG: nucleotide exchange factor GrpE [bacterium]|nr:nucleotide exchange factor GrpE [bacterium]
MSKEDIKVNGGDNAADTAPTPEHAGEPAAPEQIDALQAQIVQFREGWQRERAEFANYKRRIERETKETYQNASSDVLKSVLPILDDFDRALANVPDDLKANPWLQGVSAIQRKFIKLLDEFGVTPIDPTGQIFDPNLHQAIGQDTVEGLPSGQVTKVELRGYVVGDRVLRPALVRVNQ